MTSIEFEPHITAISPSRRVEARPKSSLWNGTTFRPAINLDCFWTNISTLLRQNNSFFLLQGGLQDRTKGGYYLLAAKTQYSTPPAMEQHLATLLVRTHSKDEGPRKQAELDLLNARPSPEFPLALLRIGAAQDATVELRQSAWSYLRQFVVDNWAPDGETGQLPPIPIPDSTKEQIRNGSLEQVLGPEGQRKVKVAASYVISKIAISDFPDEWPTLLPAVLGVMPNESDVQLHGALLVLQDLVEEALSEETFQENARNVIKACYDVATNAGRKHTHRSLAVQVFRNCLNHMDTLKDSQKKAVMEFAKEILEVWLPFLEQVVTTPLPAFEAPEGSDTPPEGWYGPVALKVQAVKILIKIKAVFPSLLLPHSPKLFLATWQELTRLSPAYQAFFVTSDTQSRLEDIDGLPYSLDFLVLDELDFLNQCMRAQPVQAHLNGDIQSAGSVHETPWVLELMELLVSYSQITQEEEGLWDIDTSLYLAEETGVSANYTSRTACGDLLIKLGEWLFEHAIEGLFASTKSLFSGEETSWQRQEAALFLVNIILSDFIECERSIKAEISDAYLQLVRYGIAREDQPMLVARGYIVAGTLAQLYPPTAELLDKVIYSLSHDESELVRVACVKSLEGFLRAGIPLERQAQIVNVIQEFLETKDQEGLEDADDLLLTLLEVLHLVINMDVRIAIQSDSKALDILFLVAKHGAENFQITSVVNEAFEDVARSLQEAKDPSLYTALCAKALPSITGTIDVANLTYDDPLVFLAAELLEVLVEYGSEPLPAGFVNTLLPKVNRLLMTSPEGEVLRPGTNAVKFMLEHDHHQVFNYSGENGRSGLEVCLHIVDRLLGPGIEDQAACAVGGLAAELVEKAGQERLGPFLPQLLQAVAARLDTAQNATLIQSLSLVFARLALVGAQDVVTFLSEIQVNGQTGLQVVLSKWLENSTTFAGYDDIRQNVIALSKIYSLNDARVAQTLVKGDLVIPTSNRIMTRSRAKQNPDQYTIIPAPLKILKLLVDELLSASGVQAATNAAAAAAGEFADADEEDGDEGWEDETGDVLDLSLASTKAELMGFVENLRQRDDETGAYLKEFFVQAARDNIAGFQEWYSMLTEDEKGKLQELA
ncbi:importin subunit beta-5 [Cladorrhinum sp. PSN332]|nr:importin subunit beta-5 [Cladorrhinum sp. PSN332]